MQSQTLLEKPTQLNEQESTLSHFPYVANLLSLKLNSNAQGIPKEKKEELFLLEPDSLSKLNEQLSDENNVRAFFIAIVFNQIPVRDLPLLNQTQVQFLNTLFDKNDPYKELRIACFQRDTSFTCQDLFNLSHEELKNGCDILKIEGGGFLLHDVKLSDWKQNALRELQKKSPLSLLLQLNLLSIQDFCKLTVTQQFTLSHPAILSLIQKEVMTVADALKLDIRERNFILQGEDRLSLNTIYFALSNKDITFAQALQMADEPVTNNQSLEKLKLLTKFPTIVSKLIESKIITLDRANKLTLPERLQLEQYDNKPEWQSVLLKVSSISDFDDILKIIMQNETQRTQLNVKKATNDLLTRIHPKKCTEQAEKWVSQFFNCQTLAEMNSVFKTINDDPNKMGLNNHRHQKWDAFFGINNTHSWQVVLETLQEKAEKQLLLEVDASKSKAEKLNLLNTALSNPLFKNHCNNFILFGAFGNTNATKHIKEKMREINRTPEFKM